MQAGGPRSGTARLALSRSTSKLTHYRTGLDVLFSWPPLPLTTGATAGSGSRCAATMQGRPSPDNGHCWPSARDRHRPAVTGLPGAAIRAQASLPDRPFQYAQASSAPAKSQPELPVTRGHVRGADAVIARPDRRVGARLFGPVHHVVSVPTVRLSTAGRFRLARIFIQATLYRERAHLPPSG
jgi:hypothetical protein